MAQDILSQTLAGIKGAAGAKEVKTNVLKAHGNVLEFQDTVYQISNMSAVEIVSFSAAFPFSAVLGVAASFALVSMGYPVRYLGFLVGAWGIFSVLRWLVKSQSYGLLLLLNAGLGASTVIRSHDLAFLREVLHALRDIMNGNTHTGMVAYFDQRRINTFEGINNMNYSENSEGDVNQTIGPPPSPHNPTRGPASHTGGPRYDTSDVASETTPPMGTPTKTGSSKD
jgi:hypothetical protein